MDLLEIGNLTRAEAEKRIGDCWGDISPNGVMYRGNNVFSVLYDEGDIFEVAEPFIPEDNQESYLGYLADEDRFIVGFDTWPREEAEYDHLGCYESEDTKVSALFFKLTPEGKITSVEPVPGMGPMFYDGNKEKLEKKYPSLYHIRLD